MKHNKIRNLGLTSISLILAGSLLSCSNKNIKNPPQPYGVLPTEHQLEWQKMEYYMFIHFGPNTFTDVEWGNGKEDPKLFNPTNVDCRQWAATAKAAGMKGIIVTAKHHDGFCLWPSKYSTHTVRESSWKNGSGDILKELSEACKYYDLKLGVYLSPWDQNHPLYGSPEYNQIFANTLKEVLGNYGEIFEQWFDGANGDDGHGGKKQIYDWNLFNQTVYEKQPQAIIFSDIGPGCRWMGNERGMAGETNWSRLNIAGFGPGRDAPPTDTLNIGNMDGAAWVPAETDVSIRPGWFYSPSTNNKVKSLEHLLDIYYTSVGRNSNLLLNVPPDRTGRIHQNDSIRLMEFRKALDETFKIDFIAGAKIKVSDTRGDAKEYSANNLLNDNYDSYWTTNDDTKSAEIEIELNESSTFNRLLLQEYIALGQRIAEFTVEAWVNNSWKTISNGTTIGYKRILRFSPVTTNKLKISITNSLACPILNKVSLFMAKDKLSKPHITRNKDGLVNITCAAANPIIYFTTDGSNPTISSKKFIEPFALAEGGTVKSIAIISDGASTSEISSKTYDIAPIRWDLVSPRMDNLDKLIDDNSDSYIIVPITKPIILDLGEIISIKGFSYTPFADEKANNIYKYNLYISKDGKVWEEIEHNASFDNIKNNPIQQDILFDKSILAKFIKLEAVKTTIDDKDYSIAGIGIITK